MSQSSSQFDVSSVNDAQHSSSLVCVWSVAAKVSAGFTNVRSLAVAAFVLVYCSLSVLRFVFVLNHHRIMVCYGISGVVNKGTTVGVVRG